LGHASGTLPNLEITFEGAELGFVWGADP